MGLMRNIAPIYLSIFHLIYLTFLFPYGLVSEGNIYLLKSKAISKYFYSVAILLFFIGKKRELYNEAAHIQQLSETVINS
jgi:hypothetical protein